MHIYYGNLISKNYPAVLIGRSNTHFNTVDIHCRVLLYHQIYTLLIILIIAEDKSQEMRSQEVKKQEIVTEETGYQY